MNKGITNYLLVVLLCAFSLISCGALFEGTTQTISVKSFQQEDGQTYVSPVLIELPRNQNYVVTISKEGYETQQVKINKTVSGGIVTRDTGGVLPVVVDAVRDTWYNLSPKEINVNLKSKQSGALDIPVKITATSDASVKIVSPQPVQIKVEKAE